MQTRMKYQKFEPFYKSKHNNIVWLIRKMVLTINFSKVETVERGLKQLEATAAIPLCWAWSHSRSLRAYKGFISLSMSATFYVDEREIR